MNDEYRINLGSWSLKKRISICVTVYLMLSIFEHLCFLASEVYKLHLEYVNCNRTDEPVEAFITRHLGFVIDNLPLQYNNFLGFFLEYLNFSYTFYWNFLDLFIIIISIGIGFLFEKINFRLRNNKGLMMSENVWAEIRYHHSKVSEILRTFNENINEMVILACLNDGYFSLCQTINITT